MLPNNALYAHCNVVARNGATDEQKGLAARNLSILDANKDKVDGYYLAPTINSDWDYTLYKELLMLGNLNSDHRLIGIPVRKEGLGSYQPAWWVAQSETVAMHLEAFPFSPLGDGLYGPMGFSKGYGEDTEGLYYVRMAGVGSLSTYGMKIISWRLHYFHEATLLVETKSFSAYEHVHSKKLLDWDEVKQTIPQVESDEQFPLYTQWLTRTGLERRMKTFLISEIEPRRIVRRPVNIPLTPVESLKEE